MRIAGDPLALANTVRRIVREAAPSRSRCRRHHSVRIIDATIVQERTFAALYTGFGALALVMACMGLYATMAYAVARRTTEIGFLMALETTAFLKSFLFGLQSNDPLALAVAAAILIACALLAGYTPAWRAARIDPMAALRHE